MPWLLVPLAIVAVFAAGLPDDAWRSPREAYESIDPRLLVPLPRFGLEPMVGVLVRWGLTAAFGAAIGAIVWAWRGGTKGVGFLAACIGFSFSLAIELCRLFKPGQLADFRDPVIAALVAPGVWWLLRRLSWQPVTPLPRHGPWQTRRRILAGFGVVGCLLALIAVVAAVVPAVGDLGLTPARIAERVARLPQDRTGAPRAVARIVAAAFDRVGLGPWLRAANRLEPRAGETLPEWSGAGPAFNGVLPGGRLRSVSTIETLRQAIDSADAGDVILLQPGTYRIGGGYITGGTAGHPGRADHRARRDAGLGDDASRNCPRRSRSARHSGGSKTSC